MAPSKKEKEVKLKVEEAAIPLDHFVIEDPVYGERNFVRDRDSYKDVTKTFAKADRTHTDRKYLMKDTASFISYVNKYGKEKDGIIFFDDAGVTMLFEETNRKESVHLPTVLSLELRSFLGTAGKTQTFTQKDFYKVLETFSECLDEEAKTLLPSIERLKLDSHIEFESCIDPHDTLVSYKDKGGVQTAHIPKKLKLTLPYFEGSEVVVEIVADLEVQKPKSEDEKPYFLLTDPKAERTQRDALDVEIGVIKKELTGWMFVHAQTKD